MEVDVIGNNKPVRQHHVPKVYLKNFRDENGSIAMYSKKNRRTLLTGLESVGVEKDFYTLEKLDDPYCWEKTYAKGVEPFMGELLPQIISKTNVFVSSGTRIFDSLDKEGLSWIMAVQFFRGKQCREFEQKIFDKELPSIIERVRKIKGELTCEEQNYIRAVKADNFYFKKSAMEASTSLKRLTKFAQLLTERSFVIYRIVGKAEFVTSDQPVMFADILTGNVKPFTNGLLQPKTLVYYPLTPKLLLCAYHSDIFFGYSKERDGCLVDLDTRKEMPFIYSINRKQVEQCYDQVYARSRDVLITLV